MYIIYYISKLTLFKFLIITLLWHTNKSFTVLTCSFSLQKHAFIIKGTSLSMCRVIDSSIKKDWADSVWVFPHLPHPSCLIHLKLCECGDFPTGNIIQLKIIPLIQSLGENIHNNLLLGDNLPNTQVTWCLSIYIIIIIIIMIVHVCSSVYSC